MYFHAVSFTDHKVLQRMNSSTHQFLGSSTRATDFDGNRLTVAEPLRQLGFYVEDLRAEPGQDAPLGPDPENYIELASRLEGSLDTARTSGQRREQAF